MRCRFIPHDGVTRRLNSPAIQPPRAWSCGRLAPSKCKFIAEWALKGVLMKCPYCGHLENRVVDSRLNKDYTSTRRRRMCEACQRRFTTHERLEVTMPMLVKKDGRREIWDRNKVVEGIKKACEKRPVSIEQIDKFVDGIERDLQDLGEREIPIRLVGERVMNGLRRLDGVAYVRFASVYRQFKDLDEFMHELKGMLTSAEDHN